ncbi:DUF2087 domain-containing protein [Undibacterium curvum]|uniref:DUF2087 domain-containing protein n=1 Tax=Undibacterium curvum TaxID=2762294 RepID=UPI003D0ED204
MNPLIQEMKTRARLLLKLLQQGHAPACKHALVLSRQQHWTLPECWQLRHSLNLCAAELGFQHWEHALQVLSGKAAPGSDMATLWHGTEVAGLTNLWFSEYAEARQCAEQDASLFLLPYRKQFMLVRSEYLQALGLTADAGVWDGIQRDLVQAYATPAWQQLVLQRLRHTRTERLHQRWNVQQANLDLHSNAQETARVMASFVRDGRLLKIPEQRKKRLVILHWLLAQLDQHRPYPEAELNQFLLQFHEDCATLRREMIMHGLMQRENAVYWCVTAANKES